MSKFMKVLKTLKPGSPGTQRLVKRFGNRLVCVRYRGVPKKNMRLTTVEIVVSQGFWMPHRRSFDEMAKGLNIDIQLST
jgi:hypothetical protein